MKKIIFALALLTLPFFASAQVVINPYTIYTVNRDTLYIKESTLGSLIYSSWDPGCYPEDEKKPVIILVQDLDAVIRKYTIVKRKTVRS